MEFASIPNDHARIALAVSITAAAIALQHFLRRSALWPGGSAGDRHAALKVGAGLIMGLGAGLGAWWVTDARPLLPMGIGAPREILLLLLGSMVLIFGVTLLASRGAGFRREYPEAPIDRPDAASWRKNALAWVVYLAGYELLFRGLCLHVLVELLGVVPGIAITTALYVVAHLPKSLTESLGSFPMGVLFAALALGGQSVLYPWVLHVAMAVFADTIAFRVRARG